MNYWEILGAFSLGSVFTLSGVLLGAYIVFRTKHAETQVPFVGAFKNKDNEPYSYADFGEPEDIEEHMSEAAKRLRSQKDGKLDMVMGKEQ